jgi:hypothetical protein
LLLVLPTCSQEVTRSVVKKTVLFHGLGRSRRLLLVEEYAH